MSDEYLYFDHAAATTVRPEAWAAVESLKGVNGGNPSSVHTPGRAARHMVDQARIQLAGNLLVAPEEVIFTSGATEALHLGIIGAYLAKTKSGGVVYTAPLVHHCVWAALEYLQVHHQVEVKLLSVTPSGHLDLEAIGEEVFKEAEIIVIEALNSEVGVLQPVAKLGKKLDRWTAESGGDKPIFVVDAAAAVVTELVGLEFQKCDLLALSGEKFGGLSGSGVLLKRKGLVLSPLIGGSQEWGYRGGSENITGIAALAVAYRAHKTQHEAQNERFSQYQSQIRATLKTFNLKIATPQKGSGRHILHFLSPKGDAALFVAQADLAGVALSAGSACSSGSVEGSRVLLNLGYSETEAQSGVRISWGWDTTPEQVDELCERLKNLLN